MPKSVNVGGTWRNVVQAFVKVGTTGGPFSNGWRTIQQGFVKVAGGWRQFFAGAITAGTVTITRSSTTHPSNLTGSTTYWDGVTTLTAVFQKSSTQTGTYTDIGTPSAIDNPVEVPGFVTTREYITTAAEFTYETPTLWYRWSVTGSDGTNNLTQNSTPVSVAFPTPIGQAGSVSFSRNSNDSYVYSIISPGNWSGSPTSYRYQWQYLSGSNWINITGATSSTFDANASYANLSDPKLDTIRPVVWASNAAGESATFIAPTAGLFVHYRKPGITSFTVTGSTGFVTYSFTEAAYNIDPSRSILISYTGGSTGSFTPTGTSGFFPTSGSLPTGTYTFTIVVTNTVTNGAGLSSDPVSVSNVSVAGLTAGSISVSPSSGQASGSNRVTIGSNLTVSIGSGWSSGLTYTYQWRHSRDQAGVGPVIMASTTTTATVPTTYVATNTYFTIGEWIEIRVTGTNAGGQSVSTTLQSYIVPPAPTFSLTDNQNSTFTISGVSSNRATYYRGSYSGSGSGTISQTAIGNNTTVNSGAGTFSVSLIAGATDFNSVARESFTAGTGSITVSNLIAPTITFNNQSATYTAGGTYALSYTTNSPGTITFSSSNTSTVTVSGTNLVFVDPGTYNTPVRTSTITLTQAAGGGYAAATRTMTFTLNPGTALVPTFSTPNRTAVGWTSSVIGYDNTNSPWKDWVKTASFSSSPTTPTPTTVWNEADGLISVTGMGSGQTTTFTLTLQRSGYQTGQGSVSASRCDAPTNSTAPTLSGTIRNGQVVTASTGTWSGASTFQYLFQMLLAGVWEDQTIWTSTNTFTIPSNATGLGYTEIRVAVRAASSCGTVSPQVNSVGYIISAATTPPTAPPTTTPPRTPPPTTAPPRTPPPTTPPPTTAPPPTTPPTPPTVPPSPPRTPPTVPPTVPPSPPRTPPTTPPPPRTPPTVPPPPRTPPILAV